MDAGSFHTHTCAHGVDAVVIAFNSDLGTLSRDAGNGTDDNQAVMNLGLVRDTMILGLLLVLSTFSMTARTMSPLR